MRLPEVLLTDRIEYPGLESHTYTELFDRYALSDLGHSHALQQPRFAQGYGYDSAEMLVDLGPDVHPVEHGRYTHDEILVPLLFGQIQFIGREAQPQLNTDDVAALRLAAYVHDFGECEDEKLKAAVGKTVGDIQYGTKTDEDDDIEASIRDYIRATYYEDIPEDLWLRAEAIIRDKDDELPTRAFNLVEHMGYYLTGLRAGYLAVLETRRRRDEGTAQRDDLSYEQLCKLARSVSTHHREETIPERLADFPYTTELLHQTTGLYQIIQDELPDEP